MKKQMLFNKGTGRQNCLYSAAAMICFLLLLFALAPQGAQKRNAARIVVLGDSTIGECRDETSVTALMSGYLGEPVWNGALGGTCYSYVDGKRRLAYTKECLNFVSLSRAVYTGDFRMQNNVRIRESASEYFEDAIRELSELDFDAVDTIILAYGINDYHGAVERDNPANPRDPYTFKGAVRSGVEMLQKAIPQVRILLVTPTYTWYPYMSLTCEDYDTGNGALEGYVEAVKELGEELGLEVIDLYHDFYAHEQYEDWKIYTRDGLHPNEMGREMIARAITKHLASF